VYRFSGISRQDAVDTTKNLIINEMFAKWFIRFDKILFNHEDPILKEAFCFYKSQNQSTGIQPNPPPPADCPWKIVEICSDLESQFTWIAGITVLPPNLDHDNDGVVNSIDQDWYDIQNRLGITQQQFDQLVEDWWDENFEDEYGNYDEYWENYTDGDGQSLDATFDALQEIMGSFWSFLTDLLDGDPNDDLYYDPNDDIFCPWDDPIQSVDSRDVRCDWFYVLDCGYGTQNNNWYEWFADVVPCPECPQYEGYDDMLRDRLSAHWTLHYTNSIDFWKLYNLSIEWECDAFSPYFEECIDEHFIESYFNAPPETKILSFPDAFNDCFLTQSQCPTCVYQYSVTLFIEQPVIGTREVYGGDGGSKNGGHVFLSLDQTDIGPGGSGLEKTLVFGWYPTNKPNGKEEVPGFFYLEDQNTKYNISLTYTLTSDQFETIKARLSNQYHLYQVGYNNCANAAIGGLIDAGISIPKTPRSVYLLGDITVNAGDLGEDLRNSHPGGSFFSSSTKVIAPPSTCQ
jgi:hypothetical protein